MTTISTHEFKRQAALAFEGQTINVMLCLDATEELDAESTVAEWQAVEKSGAGYVRFSGEVEEGSYSALDGYYSLPTVYAEFTATAPYYYNAVVVYFEGEDYVHSVTTESPQKLISAAQVQTYGVSLQLDD